MHFFGKLLMSLYIFLFCLHTTVSAQNLIEKPCLNTSDFKLLWEEGSGFSVIYKGNKKLSKSPVSGQYSVLFSRSRPDTTPVEIFNKVTNKKFPEEEYRYLKKPVADALSPVSLNLAGQLFNFDATFVERINDQLLFQKDNSVFEYKALWSVEDSKKNLVKVHIHLKARESGYFSLASPAIIKARSNSLAWGMIPGYFQGPRLESDFINAYFYGHGIPSRSVVVRDRTATTLTAIASLKNGLTVAALPAPGYGRIPWVDSTRHQTDWNLGLSLIDRSGRLSPAVHYPVLGEKNSFLNKGDKINFELYFVFNDSGWYDIYDYTINGIYRFGDFMDLKKSAESLSQRLVGLYRYISNDSLSMWRLEENEGTVIGAQSYLGGVYKANQDAMKNADYGAMWMLARVTEDTSLNKNILKFARNFKVQQQTDSGFFKGAPRGQYYLWKSKSYTEEWGDYVEPIGITYYNLIDIGNMLLFEPGDSLLRQKLKDGAERLLHFMKRRGNWAVAYDHQSGKEMFTDLIDYRPTFYGLLIAYKLLGDDKYLLAARKGADWFIKNAAEKGYFLGVCGDTRFAPDFATAQAAQALADMFEVTKEKKYLDAALEVARLYSTYIYTHPIPTKEQVIVKGKKMEEWQISQVGLNVEHGGAMGSANLGGPILLSSFAGMYIRFFKISGDSLFLNMARAAALGRDAFVNSKTKVASYYWNSMDLGAGGFPHHAWWQMGWITDYLLSEVDMRSGGKVKFPAGFMAPKVGPHKSYGFMPGNIYGEEASLALYPDFVKSSNAGIEYITAVNALNKKIYIIFLNSSNTTQRTSVQLDPGAAGLKHEKTPLTMKFMDAEEAPVLNGKNAINITIGSYGFTVLEVAY